MLLVISFAVSDYLIPQCEFYWLLTALCFSFCYETSRCFRREPLYVGIYEYHDEIEASCPHIFYRSKCTVRP